MRKATRLSLLFGSILLVSACGTPAPIVRTNDPDPCDRAALTKACAWPEYLVTGEGGAMLENHIGWVCGFWMCAEQQAALAACVKKTDPPALPTPPGCRSKPAPDPPLAPGSSPE